MKRIPFILFCLACLSAPPALAHTPDAADLLKKASNALQVKTEISTYQMTITRGKEEKSRTMDVWFDRRSPDEARALLKIKEPPNLRGTALLTVQEKNQKTRQWIYLPAYRKARRIMRGSEEESFLGSDFSIGDLSVDQAELYDFTKKADAPCGAEAPGVQCHVLEGVPGKGADELMYSRKVLMVRADNFINVRSEFFGKNGKLRKVMTAHGLRQEKEGHWSADKLRMEDLERKSVTEIKFLKRDVAKAPPASIFRVESLEK